MKNGAAPPTAPPAAPVKAEFPYGWRYVQRTLPDGQVEFGQVPLTLEDVLHPKEGDVIPENTLHDRDRGYLKDVCRARLAGRPGALVLSDCLINWGRPDLGDHSPDLAVIFDVADPDRVRGMFYVAREGVLPTFVLEIVSPETRTNDVERKFEQYHQAGVPMYALLDQQRENGPRRVVGYRWADGGFEELSLDEAGRLLVEPLGLLLGLKDGRAAWHDAETGEELGDYVQVSQALEAEIAARQAAEEQARAAEQRLRELEEQLRRLQGDSGGA